MVVLMVGLAFATVAPAASGGSAPAVDGQATQPVENCDYGDVCVECPGCSQCTVIQIGPLWTNCRTTFVDL